MVNMYVGLMLITAATVGKIMLCSVAGMLVSRHFSDPASSLKGLSHIAMKVFLPCLLFSNLCLNVTWEQLSKFYWAPLFALIPMGLGLLSSLLVRVLLTPEYRYVVILANTFQNGLAFPASVLLNLKGIEWFDEQAVVDAQSYIFLYNIACSIGLWAVGDPMIAYAKAQEVAAEEADRDAAEGAQRRQHYLDMGLAGESTAYENRSFSYPFESPRRNAEEEEEELSSPVAEHRRGATAREQLGWYQQAQAKDRPIMPPPGSPVIVLDGVMTIEDVAVVKPRGDRLWRLGLIVVKSIQSPPVLSSLLAIAISLTPPLRWLAQSPIGEPFVGGMALIGNGTIPLQLLVLGSSIAASRPKDAPAPPAAAAAPTDPPLSSPTAAAAAAPAEADGTVMDVSAAAQRPEAKGNALVRWITEKLPPQFIFTWCTVVTRLIISPCVCFLILHLLVKAGVMPNERPFLLSMLVAVMSPSAMNSTLICTMHGYHARDYARMIFFMYLSTIFTATVWLFFFIVYLNS